MPSIVTSTSTAYNTTSDYRLKENVTDLTDAITRLKKITPRRFSWIDDENIKSIQTLDSLRDSVIQALNDVVNLTSKLTNSQKLLPDKLPNNPMELSYWIGAHLGGPVWEEQQRLLEERDTFVRLQREFEMLDHTRKQLAARTALKESFPDVKEN